MHTDEPSFDFAPEKFRRLGHQVIEVMLEATAVNFRTRQNDINFLVDEILRVGQLKAQSF